MSLGSFHPDCGMFDSFVENLLRTHPIVANLDKRPDYTAPPISAVRKNYGLFPVIFCTINVKNLHLLTVYHKRFGLSGV